MSTIFVISKEVVQVKQLIWEIYADSYDEAITMIKCGKPSDIEYDLHDKRNYEGKLELIETI